MLPFIFLRGGKYPPPSPFISRMILLLFSLAGLCLISLSTFQSSTETSQKVLLFPFNYSATDSLYATWQAGGTLIRFGVFDFLVIAEFENPDLLSKDTSSLLHFDISGLTSICAR